MADTATIAGGAKSGLAHLSPAEHQAARIALARIGAADAGHGSTNFSAPQLSALGGDSIVVGSGRATLLGSGNATLIGGAGKDALAGHAGSAGNDTLVGGSAHTLLKEGGLSHSALTEKADVRSGFQLSNDTIKVMGHTAAGFKAETSAETRSGSTTITLADKTTVTLIGVHHVDTKIH